MTGNKPPLSHCSGHQHFAIKKSHFATLVGLTLLFGGELFPLRSSCKLCNALSYCQKSQGRFNLALGCHMKIYNQGHISLGTIEASHFAFRKFNPCKLARPYLLRNAAIARQLINSMFFHGEPR